jgi:uncharacterized Zn finger protein
VSYLLFVWTPTGYELREHEGEPPKTGDRVELDDRRFEITKLGVSPLPGDDRVCAVAQG